MKPIEQQIARIISRAALVPEDEVRPDAKLSELGVNSLDQIECVLAVEETFKIEVDPQVLWRLRTVRDVINAVEAAIAGRN